jgi:hypothetical protein
MKTINKKSPRAIGISHMRPGGNWSIKPARLVNEIIAIINTKGEDNPEGVVLLGFEHYRALRAIEPGDIGEVKEDRFFGWPIMRVIKDNFVALVTL